MAMQEEYSDYVYSKKDIDMAFTMGLDSAIYALEQSIGLSPEGQRHMLESLKEMIEQDDTAMIVMSDTHQKQLQLEFVIHHHIG
ncbi:hypothetical protein ACFL0H_00090 [Thermodesulfobacteriota bacterium]